MPTVTSGNNYNRIYQAYAGCDMQVHINHIPVGTLQALTISITRETVPLYVMGDPNPKTYVKGKRGIAGTLVFSTFDRHALLNDVFRDQGANPETSTWYKDDKYLKDLINSNVAHRLVNEHRLRITGTPAVRITTFNVPSV